MKIKTQKVHILGIGGIGMSGIAEILIRDGHQVSGSDMSESGNTRRLQEMGAKIFIGHEASNIEDVDYCVRSTAIPEDNIEVQTARQRSIPVLRRSEVVADLMKLNKGIAVAGTHGKTTTTSLLSTILIECKMDPTCLIGGIVHRLKSNATRGKGDFFVIEADESDGTFLKFNPVYSIVNNIDNDHLDYYETEEKVDEAFLKFMNNVPFFGRVILNLGDTRVLKVSKCLRRVYTSYGVESDIEEGLSVDFYAHSIKSDGLQTEFKIKHPSGETVVSLGLPGVYNVANATGAFALAFEVGIAPADIAKAIESFGGVGRRIEKLHECGDCIVIDDYAHHPTEVASCLKAIKKSYPDRPVYGVFEPHRYSRTQDSWKQYLHSFNIADKSFLAPIYPAGEKKITGIDSKNLVNDINELHPNKVEFAGSVREALELVKSFKGPKIILTMGAGAIGREVRAWVEEIK